jgi:hypothetical protein
MKPVILFFVPILAIGLGVWVLVDAVYWTTSNTADSGSDYHYFFIFMFGLGIALLLYAGKWLISQVFSKFQKQ